MLVLKKQFIVFFTRQFYKHVDLVLVAKNSQLVGSFDAGKLSQLSTLTQQAIEKFI